MSDVFAAIADPTRREILDLLRKDPMRAGDIAGRFPDISRPAVSKHLRVLRAARLCRVRRSGRERRYELDPKALGSVDKWVGTYRSLWTMKLGDLKAFVERPNTNKGRGHPRRSR
jgi:DNA-binding transcriptional ArsR family regulator